MNVSKSGLTSPPTTGEASAETLRQENDLLRNMLSVMPVAVCALRPVLDASGTPIDFTLLAFNDAARSLAGPARQAYLQAGASLNELLPGYREAGIFDRFRQVFATGDSLQFELPPLAEGRQGWFSTQVQRRGDALLVTYHDISQPLQTRQALNEKAALFQNVLNTIQAGVYVSEAVRDASGRITDFRILEANPVALRTLGLPAERVIGQPASAVFSAHQFPGILNRHVRVLENSRAEQYELPAFGDGQSAWFSIRLAPYGSDRVISSSLDITTIKEAQLAQQRQTQTLQSILENIPSGLFISEALYDDHGAVVDFRVLEANRVALSTYGLHGMSRTAVIGQRASVLFPNDYHNGVFERFRRVVETREPDFYTYEFHENDLPGWVDIRLTPLRDNWVIASSLDITPIKEAERAQYHQAELLQSVLNASQHSIVFLEAIRNGEGRIVDFWYAMQNETNARAIGLTDEDIRGRTLLELFSGTNTPRLFEQYVQVVETGESQRLEEYYEGGGLKGWFDISVAKRGDGVVLTIVDTTQNRQFRQQLELANAELHRSNDNLQQFAYAASHDLQEPLRKIQSFGEILRQEYRQVLDESGADLIRRMQSAADRMSVLIRDLLTYSRITTHREPFQSVDLNGLLGEVMNDLDLLIRDKAAEIDLGRLPEIHGDRSQLGQLFQNLLSNALKFTQPGQVPRIRVHSQRLPRRDLPPVLLAPDGDYYHEIVVEDNGVGFDEKYTERIFQVFQRLHGKSQFPGTGIGLAICRKVVDHHSGAITAESKPGQGATFRVYLPE